MSEIVTHPRTHNHLRHNPRLQNFRSSPQRFPQPIDTFPPPPTNRHLLTETKKATQTADVEGCAAAGLSCLRAAPPIPHRRSHRYVLSPRKDDDLSSVHRAARCIQSRAALLCLPSSKWMRIALPSVPSGRRVCTMTCSSSLRIERRRCWSLPLEVVMACVAYRA